MKLEFNKIAQAVIISLLISIAGGVWKFYHDWTVDEATEESVMFDSPSQKVITVEHAVKLNTTDMEIKILRDADIQKTILEKLKKLEEKAEEQDSLTRLGIYLTNKANKNVEHVLDDVH